MSEGVTKVFSALTDEPPVEAVNHWASASPLVPTDKVTVPSPQRLAGTDEVIVGMVFTVATTAARSVLTHPGGVTTVT